MSFFRKGNKLIEVLGNRTTQLDLSNPNIRERYRRNPEARALVDEYRVEAGLQAAAPTKQNAGDNRSRAKTKAQIQMTQAPSTEKRIITAPQRGIHTMSGQLAAETAGANNALMAEIIKNRYGLSQFSANDLISFQRDPNLQRAGVDLVTPAGLNLDFKFRGPNVSYDDVLLELVSVDSQRQLGNQTVPSTSKELMGYLNNLSPNDRLGWTMDPKKITNGIVYAMPAHREVMFINAPVLRDAAPELFDRQLKKVGGRYNPYKKAMNSTYNTVNLPIDTSIMKEVLGSNFVTESY